MNKKILMFFSHQVRIEGEKVANANRREGKNQVYGAKKVEEWRNPQEMAIERQLTKPGLLLLERRV